MTRFFSVATLLVFALGLASCWARPPLSVQTSAKKTVIDVRTLGEYPTTIAKLRLTENRIGRVVWELQAAAPLPQIWTVEVAEGTNPSNLSGKQVFHGSYTVAVPKDTDYFLLNKDTEYRIEVWGESAAGPSATRVFQFHQ